MLNLLPERYRMAPGMSRNMLEEARIIPNLRTLQDEAIGDIGKVLWVLMATIGIVLFIACANVANLLLVRVEGRQREIAVRTALGASRWQIARELLLESAVLGLTGGALGVGVAAGCLALLQSLAPSSLPRLEEITLDPVVLLFTTMLSLAAGLLFGLIPVLKCAGPQLAHGLQGGGRTMSEGRDRHRARSALVVVQVALALVLLIGAGLMIRTTQALQRVEPGFTQPEQLMTFRVSVPEALVGNRAQVPHLQQQIVNRLATIPGVESVGIANSLPTDGNNSNDPIFAETKSYRARTAFTLTMLAIAAGMALLLGLIGIYGVLSYSVTQRTREIGIRLALGAPRSNVQGLFLRYGLTLSAIGVLCGIAAAVPISRMLGSLLFEVSPADPLTYASVAALLLAAAAIAAYLPASRATAVDPLTSLRDD